MLFKEFGHVFLSICQPGQLPEDGVIVSGLYLAGAQWNSRDGLVEDASTEERYYAMPGIVCYAAKVRRGIGQIREIRYTVYVSML